MPVWLPWPALTLWLCSVRLCSLHSGSLHIWSFHQYHDDR